MQNKLYAFPKYLLTDEDSDKSCQDDEHDDDDDDDDVEELLIGLLAPSSSSSIVSKASKYWLLEGAPDSLNDNNDIGRRVSVSSAAEAEASLIFHSDLLRLRRGA